MGSNNKIYVFTILAVCVILARARIDQVSGHEGTQGHEDDESSEGSGEIKPQGRYYSLSTCEYRMQPGYSCLSCKRALHCYISNTAILVDCRGLFPYCREGRCSMYKDAACDVDTHNNNSPLSTLNTTIHHSVLGDKENVTSSVGSDSVTQMIATETKPIIPGEGIVSQGEVEAIPVDISQKKTNKSTEVLNKYDKFALSDILVNSR